MNGNTKLEIAVEIMAAKIAKCYRQGFDSESKEIRNLMNERDEMYKGNEEIVNKNGMRERSIRDMDLYEVSIIDDKKVPAYIGTSIEIRDDETVVIEFRNEEFDENSFSIEESQDATPIVENMTAGQKREALCGAFNQLFKDGWLEDYDDSFVYGRTDEVGQIYKMPYSINDGNVTIDSNSKVKVIRGGYKEIRNDESVPEQSQIENANVEKIDYSRYENILKVLKEG